MKKAWLMAAATYKQRVRSGSFLLITFGLPLIMVIAGAVPFLRASGSLPHVGFVDQTGQLAAVAQVDLEGKTLHVTRYADVDLANEAVRQGEIAGYLYIPQGYFRGEQPTFYGMEEPDLGLQTALVVWMRRAMLPEAPAFTAERLDDPARITYISSRTHDRVGEGAGMVVRFAAPALLALAFALIVFTSTGQMGSAVVREKDQRAMEIVITSLRPIELVGGKVLGMALLSLTQIVIWTLGGIVALVLMLSGTGTELLQEASIPWQPMIWAVLLGIPGYLLYAAIASGLGIIAGNSQQAQQLAGMLGFLGMTPLYFLVLLINAPNGPFAIAMTLFPLTAPMTALFRMIQFEVPVWQLAASLAILVVSLAGSVWVVARIFRTAMLMYGQALRPRQIWQALRQA